jgi:hypothetical protein
LIRTAQLCPARLPGGTLALGLFLTLAAPAARAQGGVSIETSEPLFVTMCALYAAGYDAESAGTQVHPVRARLRERLAVLQGPAVEAVRVFYREHRQGDAAATLSRYISFALSVGPAPKFEYTSRRDALPPDVLALEGFNEILAAFYAEAQIGALWEATRPEYQKEVRGLERPVAQIVVTATGYLREIIDPGSERRFYIYLEPLVGAKTNVRNYGDHNYVVMSPSATPPLDDIRHAFLHFLLDPLHLRHRGIVQSRSVLLRYAAAAPRLPAEYKEDFGAFLTECLVRAAELRLRNVKPADVELTLAENDLEGYVLVRPLHRELQVFEQSEPAMARYFPELIRGIRLSEEGRRLEKMQYAAARQTPAEALASPAPQLSAAEQELRAAEKLIAANDGPAASAAFQRILEREPGNLRAIYGYAVASVLEREGERAKEYFQKLVQPASAASNVARASSDPGILSWSHYYLGRIHDVEGSRELALSEYRAALAVEGAPEAARAAARRALDEKDPAKRPQQ